MCDTALSSLSVQHAVGDVKTVGVGVVRFEFYLEDYTWVLAYTMLSTVKVFSWQY